MSFTINTKVDTAQPIKGTSLEDKVKDWALLRNQPKILHLKVALSHLDTVKFPAIIPRLMHQHQAPSKIYRSTQPQERRWTEVVQPQILIIIVGFKKMNKTSRMSKKINISKKYQT